MAAADNSAVLKRPLTPAFAYIHANYAALNCREDVKSSRDVCIFGAREYKELPDEEKAKWTEQFHEEMKAYKKWASSDEGRSALAAKLEVEHQKKMAAKQAAEKKKEAQQLREAQEKLKEAQKLVICATSRVQSASRATRQHPMWPVPIAPATQYLNKNRANLQRLHPQCKNMKRMAERVFRELPEDEQAPFSKEQDAYNQWLDGEAGAAARAAAEEHRQANEAVGEAQATVKELEAAISRGFMAPIEIDTPSTPGKKRPADKVLSSPAKVRSAAGGRSLVAAGQKGPVIEEAVLEEAKALDYDALLTNLANRPEVATCGKSSRELLDALKASRGLVNVAKRMLLGL